MPELFDMIAGSDTGAIIASTLVVPKQPGTDESKDWKINQFWAKSSMEFFMSNSELWESTSLSIWWQLLITILLSVSMGSICFMCIRRKLNPRPGIVKKINSLKILIDYKRDAFNNKMEISDDNKEEL